MSTDLYGVRVLAVDPDRRRAHVEVFVVYYDTRARTCAPLPDDPSFFLAVLWHSARWSGPLGELIGVDQILDEDWVETHTRWFIEQADRISTRNHPPTDEDFARLSDFYHERLGGWRDEDRLVQAEYEIRVTDPRWLEHLSPGDSWGETAYPLHADQVRRADAPHVPDLRNRAATLLPFAGADEEQGTPDQLAFSDDGRYLAVASQACELVVYETGGWTEHARAAAGLGLFPSLTWAPGTHTVALEDFSDGTRWLYDVAAGAPADLPAQPGRTRSRTGRYRVEYGDGDWIDFVGSAPAPCRTVPVGADEPGFVVEHVAFTADETRMFAAGTGPHIHVLDPSTGDAVDTLADAGKRVSGLAVSPDGGYLAATVETGGHREDSQKYDLCVWRTADHRILTRQPGGPYGGSLAWSPDGRWLAAEVVTGAHGYGGEIRVFPVGLPAEPPASLTGRIKA